MLKKRKTPLNALFPEREGIRVYPISNNNNNNNGRNDNRHQNDSPRKTKANR